MSGSPKRTSKKKFIFEFQRAPGDVLLLTALVRDLKLTYGDRYQVDVRTQYPAIWRHNPHLTKLMKPDPGVQIVPFNEGSQSTDLASMRRSQQGHKEHYLTGVYRHFYRHTKIRVPCLFPKGDLHLSEDEKNTPRIDGRYWVIVPGGKTDMTAKFWHQHRYEEVVDQLRPKGFRFVQEGCNKPLHRHPPLKNVLNAVGQTSIRDLIVNIFHAEGVICGVTFQMHICGALEKPCVIIAGGREEPWYEEYSDEYGAFGDDAVSVRVPHRLLHTLGQLPCCRKRGCWHRRVLKLYDGRDDYDKLLCQRVHYGSGRPPIAKCMHMIETAQVTEAVLSYYGDGTLLPLPEPEVVKRPVTSDDLFVPPETALAAIPQFISRTEHMQTKQAKPDANKGHRVPEAPLTQEPSQHPRAGRLEILDHAKIGGKLTVCVLLFGDNGILHRRCLQSICETLPPSRMDLRVALNQTGLETRNMLEIYPVTKVYTDEKARRKFQAMREMFHDRDNPIVTKWVVWFDDICYIRNAKWASLLAETIVNQDEKADVGALGNRQRHQLKPSRGKDPRQWFKNGEWWKGRHFCNKTGADSPNGNQVHYVNGNFFAIQLAAIQACNIPDCRIVQSGGAVCIGEQLHQNGWKLKQFNQDFRHVYERPEKQQRGYHCKYPWH